MLIPVTSMEAVMFGRGEALLVFALLVAMPAVAVAQTSDTATPPTAPSQSTQPQPDQPLLKPEQVDALVAPIALYPDPLLVNVLAASTYPLEVVQADRWVKANKNLKGEALRTAVDKQAWDDSVK